MIWPSKSAPEDPFFIWEIRNILNIASKWGNKRLLSFSMVWIVRVDTDKKPIVV